MKKLFIISVMLFAFQIAKSQVNSLSETNQLCDVVRIINNCPLTSVTYASFFNPDCSMNPAITVDPGQDKLFNQHSLSCADAPPNCPVGIRLLDPPNPGFIDIIHFAAWPTGGSTHLVTIPSSGIVLTISYSIVGGVKTINITC
jgi:hypothetical protein